MTFEASGIYMIRNNATGKYYIGSAVNLQKRFSQHLNGLRASTHFNRHLKNAWDCYGEQSFEFIVLCEVPDKAKLIETEQAYIDSFFAAKPLYGYNSRPTAHSNFGHVFSEETRRRITAALIGRRHSEETKEKMRIASIGKKKSLDHALNISKAKIGISRPDVSLWAPEKLSMFNQDSVAKIRADRNNGMTYRSLAEKYKCSQSTAHFVVNGTGAFYGSLGS